MRGDFFRGHRIAAGILLLNGLLWVPTLRAELVFDDRLNVVANPWIRSLGTLAEAFRRHAAAFDPTFNTSFFRPMMHVFYGITYAVFGLRPWAFHLVNVVFHAVAAVLVYQLAAQVQRRWAGDGAGRYFAPVAGLVFSLHPIHTEAVAWVAGITDLSYSVCGLLALRVYVAGFRRHGLIPVSAVLFLMALFCKETAASMLPLALTLEWGERQSDASWTARRAAVRLGMLFGASGLYLLLRFQALGTFAPSAAQHPHGVGELLGTAASLFARYLSLLAAPTELNVMREVPIEAGLGTPWAVAGLALAGGCVAVAASFRRFPLGLFALVSVVVPILPALYFPAIESGWSIVGERYLYLPVMGVGWGVGLAVDALMRRSVQVVRLTAVCAAVVAAAAVGTVLLEQPVWASELNLWANATAKAPGSSAAHEGHCFALYQSRRFGDALHACERAIALDEKRIDARVNRANTLLVLGRVQEGLAEFDRALTLRPDSADAWVGRGLALMALGRTGEALACYRRALRHRPEHAEANNDLGVALVRLGQPAAARSHFEAAVRANPANLEYQHNLRSCPR